MAFGDDRKPLNRDPEKQRAFQQRGRESSARVLGMSAREAAKNMQRAGRAGQSIASAGFTPASKEQRDARDEVGYCIACAATTEFDGIPVDPAHLISRAHGGCDSRFCTVPLCRLCHRRFDDGELDLLSVLVGDWGRWRHHYQHALTHELPVPLLERLAGARTQWSDDPRREAA